jgi:hypothetical protein
MNDLVVEGLSPKERAAFTTWFRGNQSALDFADMLVSATHVWDDLIDGDKEVPPELINKAFMVAFIGLWRNEFFAAHAPELIPLLEQAINDWMDANQLEKEHNLPAAFTLRCAFATPIIRCAYLIGGHDWGRAASMDIRRVIFDDYNDYVKEHGG